MIDIIKYTRCKQAEAPAGVWSMPISRDWNPYTADAFSGLGTGATGGGDKGIGSIFKNMGKGKLALYGGLGLTGIVGVGALIRSMNMKRKKNQQQQSGFMGR